MKRDNTLVIVSMTVAMALAGSSVVVGKTLARALPVFLTTCATLLVALVVILPLIWRRRQEIRRLTGREWCNLFLQGFCGIVLFRVLLLLGLRHIDAARAGIITGSTPAVLTLLAWLLLRERPAPRALTGVICAVLGGIGLALNDTSRAGATLSGSLFILGAVVSEAYFSILRKQVATSVPATVNTAVLIFSAFLTVLPLALLDLAQGIAAPTPAALAAIVYYGAIATVLAYLLWTSGVGKVSGATAGVISAAMPASAVLLSALVLREPLQAAQIMGCALVMLGVLLVALPAGRTDRPDKFPQEQTTAEGKSTPSAFK